MDDLPNMKAYAKAHSKRIERAVQLPTEDLVGMARAAALNERLSDGALYRKLADELERLRAIEKAATSEQSMIGRVADAIASNLCSGLSYEAVTVAARASIEAMRAVPDVCHDEYRCDRPWRELDSKVVWHLWLDAALAKN